MKTSVQKFANALMWLIAFGFFCVFAFWPFYGFAADAGACYSIQDSDARTYCLARAHREPAQCYSIQRADLRAQCRAEVSK